MTPRELAKHHREKFEAMDYAMNLKKKGYSEETIKRYTLICYPRQNLDDILEATRDTIPEKSLSTSEMEWKEILK